MAPLPEQLLAQQVDLLESMRQGQPVPVTELTTSLAQRKADLKLVQAGTRGVFPTNRWQPKDEEDEFAPVPSYHMYLRPIFIAKLKELQSAFTKVSSNIVDRWFSDEAAGFPARMPIEPHEHALLKWIATSGIVPSYDGRQGCWRPDYLFSSAQEPSQPVICEINARFPYNAWVIVPLASQSMTKNMDLAKGGLKTGHSYAETMTAVLGLFDNSRPVHVLMGEEWKGFDIHVLPKIYEEKTGQPMRVIHPADLRLTTEIGSPTGHVLSCVTKAADGTETTERIWQISMEIKQKELRSVDPLVLRELARICVNDFRSIFLVHDQRFLAIMLEELDHLVATGVIDEAEAEILRRGIAPTHLPGSRVWQDLMSSSLCKDDFMLKTARDGEGKGHTFGHNVSQEEWISHLKSAADQELSPADSFALQRKVDQFWFDILNLDGSEMSKLHVVGSWTTINGRFLGTLGYRLAKDLCFKVAPGEPGIAMFAVTDIDEKVAGQ